MEPVQDSACISPPQRPSVDNRHLDSDGKPMVAVGGRAVENFKSLLRSHRALNKVSLTIEQGEMVGLIGASGSGKSTRYVILLD